MNVSAGRHRTFILCTSNIFLLYLVSIFQEYTAVFKKNKIITTLYMQTTCSYKFSFLSDQNFRGFLNTTHTHTQTTCIGITIRFLFSSSRTLIIKPVEPMSFWTRTAAVSLIIGTVIAEAEFSHNLIRLSDILQFRIELRLFSRCCTSVLKLTI